MVGVRRWPLIVFGIVLATAAYAIGPYPVGVFYDDGIYLILGKSLATGEGYRFLNIPGHPAAAHYPPGYPALLALLLKLTPAFPANVTILKLVNALLLATSAAGMAYFGRTRLGMPMAVAVLAALAGALAVPVLAMTTVLFSEPLYLALLVPCLLAAERLLDDEEHPAAGVAAGVMAGLLTMVRSIGLALVVATVVALLLRRRRGVAGMFAASAAMVMLPWQLWMAMYNGSVHGVLEGSYGTYVGWLLEAVRQQGSTFPLRVAARNAAELVRPMWGMFATSMPAPLAAAVLVPLGVVGWMGLRRLRRHAPVTDLYLVIYLAIVLLWPYVPDRFLWGVWSLVWVVLALGALELAAHRPQTLALRGGRVLLAVACVVAVGSYSLYHVRGYRGRWWEGAQRSAADRATPLARWVTERTLLTDVVATDSDPLIYLYTGRKTVPAVNWSAAEYVAPQQSADMIVKTRTLIEAYDVRFMLVLDPTGRLAYASDKLRHARPPVLRLVDTLSGGGLVYVRTRR